MFGSCLRTLAVFFVSDFCCVEKTEGFVVISRSKLDPCQDDLRYLRVTISSHNGFLLCYMQNKKHLCKMFCSQPNFDNEFLISR